MERNIQLIITKVNKNYINNEESVDFLKEIECKNNNEYIYSISFYDIYIRGVKVGNGKFSTVF